jgi:hypothetical protein
MRNYWTMWYLSLFYELYMLALALKEDNLLKWLV